MFIADADPDYRLWTAEFASIYGETKPTSGVPDHVLSRGRDTSRRNHRVNFFMARGLGIGNQTICTRKHQVTHGRNEIAIAIFVNTQFGALFYLENSQHNLYSCLTLIVFVFRVH